ncbi:uncharacterized protein STEHIDRAFT_42280, partial [Stereum hirsutum FP-91666 SS1]|uniref:uncharacterized protein n=1 Tax=Stereum hirsutum (strain FP-91666) TaxID=721885 RepID=UPI0004449938
LDLSVLDSLIDKLKSGKHVDESSQAERDCYRLLSDLDHVSGKVKGSRTTQKWKRNEAWSMITHLGAPSWFVTIAPADQNSPLCLKFASAECDDKFDVDLLDPTDKVRLVGRNPVASARFFNIVVTLFIKHILGHKSGHIGIFGETVGFYGTVEQ